MKGTFSSRSILDSFIKISRNKEILNGSVSGNAVMEVQVRKVSEGNEDHSKSDQLGGDLVFN